MKKSLLIIAKILVTAFLIVYLFMTKGIDLRKSWHYIQSTNWWLLILAFLVLMGGQFICSIRWRKILLHLQIRIPQLRLFYFYLIGMFFSLFFPSIVGGDLVKIYYVKKDSGKSLTYALTSVYLDRATGFLALLLYGWIGALVYPLSMTPEDFRPIGWLGLQRLHVWILPALAMVVFLLANWVLFSSRLYNLVVRFLETIHLGRLAEKILLLRDAMRSFRGNLSVLLVPMFISLVNIASVILMNWFIAISLGMNISLAVLSAVISLMTLLVMLPISINGIGLRENSLVVLLALVGVEPEKSLALSLISFFLIVLSALPGGVCYSLLKKEIPVPPEEEFLELTT
jgi:uncharacterized protein (TIRG00374 family)